MGHYDDAYEEDYALQRKEERELLLEQLNDLREFRSYNPTRKRRWRFTGKVKELYDQMLVEIQAELYQG